MLGKKTLLNMRKKGILALPTSQQPGPLFCFGQNSADQGDLQAFGIVAKNKQSVDVVPTVLYGVSDSFSLLCAL